VTRYWPQRLLRGTSLFPAMSTSSSQAEHEGGRGSGLVESSKPAPSINIRIRAQGIPKRQAHDQSPVSNSPWPSLLSFWQLPPRGLRFHRRFLGQLTFCTAPRAAHRSFAQERGSRGAERARPVARRRRERCLQAAAIRHVDLGRTTTIQRLREVQGWTDECRKRNTVRLLFRPAGDIDGSHAVLTSTAISTGPNTVRGVFRTAREKAALSLCFKDERRAPKPSRRREHGHRRP
jgi:hypothetical protein